MHFGQRPDPAKVDEWNRTYLEHSRSSDDPTSCAVTDCLGRFPCAARVEVAELLIMAGLGVPRSVRADPAAPRLPAPRAHRVRLADLQNPIRDRPYLADVDAFSC
ncbi:hypothetical protein Asi02nite_78480 [Asanoa siamensis]|uniref:Uncharacterized protein n=1 Tax=Asanoa siamensis TaxID=926357 RepID=A0ABQ4D461_9ACTN|nr:hypothetical protein Asi02nite_78480 [Asanoa siamensis]